MRKNLAMIGKLMVSGMMALLILSVFCLIYDNPPYAAEQPDGLTNYQFEENRFWMTMTEGWGYGVTSNIGYNGAADTDYSDPVIVFLGSSHTEALQVPQNRNYVSLIQEKLDVSDMNEEELKCVNLGISGHYFPECVSHLKAVSERFEDLRYVVIEVRDFELTEEELEGMTAGKYHDAYEEQGGLYGFVRRIPYFRMLKKQLDRREHAVPPAETRQTADYEAYERKLDEVIGAVSEMAEQHGYRVLIFYHCAAEYDEEDGYVRADDLRLRDIFSARCADYGIGFIDITDHFTRYSAETHRLPYGFFNTVPGTGHLNETGHAIVADDVYGRIREMIEEDKNGI